MLDSNVGAGSTGQVLISVGSGISWSSMLILKLIIRGNLFSTTQMNLVKLLDKMIILLCSQDRVGIGASIPNMLQLKKTSS